MNEFDPDREARKVLWATLIFSTVCSLAANITHSIRIHHGGWAAVGPVLLAMLAPVALLILFHLLGVWARRAGYRSVTYWVFLAAVLGLGAAAFRLSFAAIRDLAMEWGYGYGDAALFPLILDGLIAVCTVGLVATQRPKAVQGPSAEALPHPHPAAQRVQSAPVLQPIAPAVTVPTSEQVEAVPQSQPVQSAPVAPVEWPTPGLSQPMQWAGQSGAEPVVSSENMVPHLVTAPVAVEPEQVEAPVLAVEQEPITEPMQSVPAADAVPHPVEVEQPAEALEQSRAEVEQLPQPEQSPSRPQLVAVRTEAEVVHRVVEHKGGAAPVTESHVVEAEQLRDRGVTGKPAPGVADTLALADEKVSRNEIARVTGWSTHTVSKVLNGRETETEAVNA